MAKTKVGILNVTGYAGVELARLLAGHPYVELASVTGRSAAGQKIGQVFPHMAALDLTIQSELSDVDFVFSALPHHESAGQLIPFIERGIRVIDISADFRLKEPSAYEKWYDFSHPAPGLLKTAVYGLPELHRDEIQQSKLVANPGCYPTASILALAPAIKGGIVSGNVIVDAKSGLSGAGRSLKLSGHFCEVDEDVTAYAITSHRHQPEILQELVSLNHDLNGVTFTPHLIPMTRGILATCYGQLTSNISDTEIAEVYREFYRNEPFVRVVPEPPHIKHTAGTNMCLVYAKIDHGTGFLITVAAIDNLIKGAAGQAIQNMNLMLGFPEDTGLTKLAQFP
jgi:N-acetyl-gamma-glutamyl-phosphate reductase